MHKSKKKLMKNTFMLYLIQFSNYFFNFIVIPYETRILGPGYYGKISVATAVITYFQLLLDFGFLLSATEEVSRYRDDKEKLRRVYTCVTILKVILSIGSLAIMVVICLAVPDVGKDAPLYFWYLITAVIYCFLPDYLYRGLEKMEAITYRTVLVKLFSVVMIFIFLKKPEDYLIVPIFSSIGNLLAVLWAAWDVRHKLDIRFKKVSVQEVYRNFKRSSAFFLSRIISTVYTATNTVIVGMMDKTQVMAGYYGSATKLMTTGQKALTPISDSVYPYMVGHKDLKLIKKIMKFFMPPIIIGSILIFIYAEPLCVFAFGKEYAGTAPILRALMPLAIITLPNYLFGFPALSAIGLSKHANYAIYAGTAVHVVFMVILFFTGHFTPVMLALSTSIADIVCTVYRMAVVYKNRHLYNQ